MCWFGMIQKESLEYDLETINTVNIIKMQPKLNLNNDKKLLRDHVWMIFWKIKLLYWEKIFWLSFYFHIPKFILLSTWQDGKKVKINFSTFSSKNNYKISWTIIPFINKNTENIFNEKRPFNLLFVDSAEEVISLSLHLVFEPSFPVA